MSERKATTLQDLEESGALDGYHPGLSSRWRARMTELASLDVDREVAALSPCTNCRRVGLTTEYFSADDDSSYRGFEVCPACQHAEEF